MAGPHVHESHDTYLKLRDLLNQHGSLSLPKPPGAPLSQRARYSVVSAHRYIRHSLHLTESA
jgi:hypothetical protein